MPERLSVWIDGKTGDVVKFFHAGSDVLCNGAKARRIIWTDAIS